MQKFLATLLVLLLLSASAVAESLNLAEMDDSSLLALKKAVETEYNSRLVSDPILLEPGTYIVGKDLRAGRWYARVNTYKPGILAESHLEVTGYKANGESFNIYRGYAQLGGKPSIIDVSEGDKIEVRYFPMAFKQSEFDEDEIYKCDNPDGTCVFPGIYKVGVDIPVGTYRVRIGSAGGAVLRVEAYDPADDSYRDKYEVGIQLYDADRSALIRLEEGDRFRTWYNVIFMTREESNIKFTFD